MIFLTAILSFAGLLLALAIFLGVAERFLVTYGTCKITINGGESVLEVNGGQNLLSTLAEAKVFIPSACGGKGSCGYCKVAVFSGGGPVLPTETPYLTRAEMHRHMRLACQVKVKSDMDIRIPDLLETVRSMVANKTFNPNSRWRWSLSPAQAAAAIRLPEEHLEHHDKTAVRQILDRHADRRGSIVPILQDINQAFSYLPEPALRYMGESLNMPVSQIYRVATFYNAFSLKPRGRNIIKVCLGTACYVKGGQKILERVESHLGVGVGECTPDRKFSIETVSCIGCCGQAPSLCINDKVYGYLKPEMMEDLLKQFS